MSIRALGAGCVVCVFLLLGGCVSVPTPTGKAAAKIGCCTNTTYTGKCAPSALVPNRLECLPLKPAAPACVNDAFKCDDLPKAPVDNCLHRDDVKGLNTPCSREVSVTSWDPYGTCVKNVCTRTPTSP